MSGCEPKTPIPCHHHYPPPPLEPLINAFNGLPKPEREILQFLSILFEFVNRTNLALYLPKAGIKGVNGKAITTTSLKPVVAKLAKLGLVQQNNHLFRCADEIAGHATRSAVDEGTFEPMAKVIQQEVPAIPSYYAYTKELPAFERGYREIRIGVYRHDLEQVNRYLSLCRQQFPEEMALNRPLAAICGSPFHVDRFRGLPLSIQALALEEMVMPILSDFGDISEILTLLRSYRDSEDEHAPRLRKTLAGILLFQGNLAEAQALLDSGRDISEGIAFQGWLHFLRGENDEAIRCFEAGLTALRKVTGKKKAFFPDPRGLFYLLALLKTKDAAQHQKILEFIKIADKQGTSLAIPAYRAIRATLLAQANKPEQALSLVDTIARDTTPSNPMPGKPGIRDLSDVRHAHLTECFGMLARFWIDPKNARKNNHGLQEAWAAARENGYPWAAMEIANLLHGLGEKITWREGAREENQFTEYAAAIQADTGIQSLLPIVAREEKWERALKALVQVGVGAGKKSLPKKTTTSRLVWMVHMGKYGHVDIRPREQVCSATGNWSKGRPVALKRLFEGSGKPDFLTDQDRRICAAIDRQRDYYGYYGNTTYEFNAEQAMLAMVGHPLVFLEQSPKVSIEVVKAEPELLVRQQKGEIQVELSGNANEKGIFIEQETPTRIKVIQVTDTHEAIIHVLGQKGLEIPAEGKGQVLEAVQALSSMVTVHSGIGGSAENIPDFFADRQPRIHLLPMGDGLKVNLLVRPFADDGPYFQPGQGGGTIIAEVKGKRMQTTRNLGEEKKLAEQVVDECPALAGMEDGQATGEWILDEQDRCLELLLELRALGEKVIVEWPEGEKLKVRHSVAMDSLRVTIRRDHDWFAVTGQLTLDESLVLDMARLLELTRGNESRFVPMGDGQFIALTETFRRRLAEIEAFSEKSAKGQRFHGVAGLLLQDLAHEAGALDADKHWKSHIQRIRDTQALEPSVPSTLQAELRDYQVAGFQWLARLAAWGVGGCLADDMGLGKTLQALALILDRAPQGPSLVVAPTSVCLNWQGEIQRFAPTLNGIYFGPGNRQEILDGLKPFDLLICSYGLLQQEAGMLTKVPWNVIVLDEAQAIKNRLTKRSKAAMALAGTFRMITTGTPIENHLGELWNLFRFINPGLLGSLERFNEGFAIPVERHGDKATGKRLKKLIQPFLLRRAKSQVLEELPSRTEIVLHVEMSPEESAFYETLRQQAVQQIEELEGPMEQKNFRILAELMRLRRACCNSRLVLPESPIQSTKLALFQEVLGELLENRHKALVFSQFVDHLAILRESLDARGIAYQYLDGGTPAKERKRRVDAFQAGEGDVFLISLKAGGLGINLTAADYVIHMDPWWNPAVEDQASDRAHRIGQRHPVTIYRLVTKDIIEEKIVDLHRHKRDLADGLLEGGEMSARMSAEELLRLIREEG
uniref:Superfamily II DNA or RNA helicase, SNF2 family n=1 Tax=Candidatus Kentrum eta TaxID=2126337 RepID=A0A450UIV4_9GAMM|nr:MAG: Superfamily II DNA or RNA helicase, SNF2 family [Candidatus Kentron sp. H]VFJ92465.1 MAG: Superfamily II DNA or RNA helicase, SNF2 family [Candidatus Kentron sp. H]VFJ99236.1 MAG: Superfamily II DNA or RNA helicase, SNF2 family [Candidatus Kentron sp. H]